MNPAERLHRTELAACSVGNHIEQTRLALYFLGSVSAGLYEMSSRSNVRSWLKQEEFKEDRKGYFRQSACKRTAPNAFTYFWQPQNITEEICFRMYALHKMGMHLVPRFSDSIIYYQDDSNTSFSFSQFDVSEVIPPDFDWHSYYTFKYAAPALSGDRRITRTPPNMDYATPSMLTTFSLPIFLAHEFAGLWSIDMPLHKIQAMADSAVGIREAENFIVDRDGNILIHPLFEKIPEEQIRPGDLYQMDVSRLDGGFGGMDLRDMHAHGSGTTEIAGSDGQNLNLAFTRLPYDDEHLLISAVPSLPSAARNKIKATRRLYNFWSDGIINAAVTLRIFDLLPDSRAEAKSAVWIRDEINLIRAEEKEEQISGDGSGLLHLLRLLVSIDLAEEERDLFWLTPAGCDFRTGRSLWHLNELHRHELMKTAYDNLFKTVLRSSSEFRAGGEAKAWFYELTAKAKDPQFFHNGLKGYASFDDAIVNSYEWERFNHIIDLGGGDGHLVARIMERCGRKKAAAVRGSVFEMRTEAARALFDSYGLTNCNVIEGNMDEDAIPSDGDLYILKWNLHNRSDESCRTVLRNVHRAMQGNPCARLLIIEIVLAPKERDVFKATMNYVMATLFPGARERSEGEFRALLEETGFEMSPTVIHTECPLSIIEAHPIQITSSSTRNVSV